jgi:phospholipid transport system transporter-binding protein
VSGDGAAPAPVSDGAITFELPTRVTMDDATAVLRGIEGTLAGARAGVPLHVDAQGLTELDSAAVALLLHTRRLAIAAGRGFVVVGAPPKLQALAGLYGVESLLAGVDVADSAPPAGDPGTVVST